MKKLILVGAFVVLVPFISAWSCDKMDGPGKPAKQPGFGEWHEPMSPSPTATCLLTRSGCITLSPKK